MRSFHREDCRLATPDASSRNARGESMHFSSWPNPSRIVINSECRGYDHGSDRPRLWKTTALVDDGSVNDCDQQTALRGIDPTFLQIGECVDSAVAEEGPVRSSRVD